MVQRYALQVLVAGMAMLAVPAAAQPAATAYGGGRTGELAALCSATPQNAAGAASVAYCQGFFVAAGQYHQELSAAGGVQQPIFCLPTPSPTFDDARMAFVSWAQNNPQYKDDRSIDSLLRFAATTYPCPDQPAATRRRR